MEKFFDQDPVENRRRFAEDLRGFVEESKDTLEPATREACLACIEGLEQEASAHMMAMIVSVLTFRLEEWEKMKCPPFRNIICLEKDLTLILGGMEIIPEHMRAGAAEDLQAILRRLQKLQE